MTRTLACLRFIAPGDAAKAGRGAWVGSTLLSSYSGFRPGLWGLRSNTLSFRFPRGRDLVMQS